MQSKVTELSDFIKELRLTKGLSLRQVEKKTGISNAYLSQLENSKIEKPSPHILHKLAKIYDASYETLMKLAGYIKKKDDENLDEKIINNVAFSAINKLTHEEKKELIEFIKYLKSKRRK